MPKVLFVIAPQNFRDEEFSIPKQILERERIKITVASITTDTCTGMLGLRIKPDIAVIDAREVDYDGIVIVGGSGSPRLADSLEVTNLVKRFFAANKLIASICLAAVVLARAGILKGKSATVYPADFAVAELQRSGAFYEEKKLVVDGKSLLPTVRNQQRNSQRP